MEVLLTLIVYGIFIAVIVKVIRRVNGNTQEANKIAQGNMLEKVLETATDLSNTNRNYPKASNVSKNTGGIKSSSINKHMASETKNARMMDDRSNDWLAKQLREERVSFYRMSAMFDLKTSHKNSCEAEMIRRFHEDNCDAGVVDAGEA